MKNKNCLIPPMFLCLVVIIILFVWLLVEGGTIKINWPQIGRLHPHRVKGPILTAEAAEALIQLGMTIERLERHSRITDGFYFYQEEKPAGGRLYQAKEVLRSGYYPRY